MPPRLLQRKEEIDQLASQLSSEKWLAIDTEFIRETTFYPAIALIQVANETESWLLDPTTLSAESLEPIFKLFRDPAVMKIMHAAYADQECFYTTYGFLVDPVLDTAVAGALLGMGDNAGLGRLLKELLGIYLPKGRARARWLSRPLPAELLHYAQQDVAHLVKLGQLLKAQLELKGRLDWAMEAGRIEGKVFEVSPEEMALKMAKNGHFEPATYPVLVELLRWREERARRANLPRGWVADNETLLSLSKVRPKTIEDLRSFRGLNPKEVERSGKAILEAVGRGLSAPNEHPAFLAKQPTRSERENHILDFIHTYVSFLAARHEIAVRYLINSAKLHLLLSPSARPGEGWVEQGILTAKAYHLIGEDLIELLAGKRALALVEGRVQILPL